MEGRKERDQKIEGGGAAWVLKGGCHFANTRNNQIKFGVLDRGRVRKESGRACGCGRTCGGMPCRWFGRQIKSTKIKREGDGAMAVGGRH